MATKNNIHEMYSIQILNLFKILGENGGHWWIIVYNLKGTLGKWKKLATSWKHIQIYNLKLLNLVSWNLSERYVMIPIWFPVTVSVSVLG